ncbi:uncharacterized protein LOC115071136 isoform X2 [Nannospalax galili]|uniref:uncharacterized protein LOC115071136 isoform X2 n=1 Tax=Nannospalax galili TaxID=1026970 RepID=UPI00111BD082|nr:uncharacterized protein LOC115071136 isoform X2 [Nannospalax galili]
MAAAAPCQGSRLLLLLLLLLRARHPAPLRQTGPCTPSAPSAGSTGQQQGVEGKADELTRRAPHTVAQPFGTITAAAVPPPRLRADPEVLQPPAPPEERGGAVAAPVGRSPPTLGAPPTAAPATQRARSTNGSAVAALRPGVVGRSKSPGFHRRPAGGCRGLSPVLQK